MNPNCLLMCGIGTINKIIKCQEQTKLRASFPRTVFCRDKAVFAEVDQLIYL